jgi:hypothetical protein
VSNRLISLLPGGGSGHLAATPTPVREAACVRASAAEKSRDDEAAQPGISAYYVPAHGE